MKRLIIGTALVTFLFIGSVSYGSENDLPLSDNIKILKVTPLGANAKEIFEIELKTITYESMKSAVIEKIKSGYKPDCECDFDNDYFIQLENRPILYGTERDNPPVIRFPGTLKKDGDPLTRIRFECRVIMSENKKFAGLIFRQIINDGLMQQHFMLVNSKGEILWEMPHEMKETLADNLLTRIKYPNDLESRIDGHYRVSNNGKVLYSKSHMHDTEKFWELYHKDGKRIKKEANWCAMAEFSPDGRYFLVQENNDPRSHQFDMDSGTSCYDADTGKLLWRKKEILPIHGPGYFISPSGKKIVACCKNRFYEICIVSNVGKIIAKAGNPQKNRCTSYQSNLHWSPNEKIIFWRKSIIGENLSYWDEIEPIQTFPDISKNRKDELSGVLITDIVPLSDKYLFAIGFRRTHSFGKTFTPAEKYKFIAILDYRMDILGISFFETENSMSTNFRIMVDETARKFYIFSDDLLIDVEFVDAGDQK